MSDMEFKHFKFEIKAEDDGDMTVSGYASIFGNRDRVGDVVVAGAFTKSLASGRKVKMLWQHDSSQVIGVWDEMIEDDKGLFIQGRFANTEKGKEIRELAMMGAIDSFSIGYRTLDYEYSNSGDRLLKEVDLFEVSLVTFPANELATITAVKTEFDEERELLSLMLKRIELLTAK